MLRVKNDIEYILTQKKIQLLQYIIKYKIKNFIDRLKNYLK